MVQAGLQMMSIVSLFGFLPGEYFTEAVVPDSISRL